jgi:hypothetical protein
MSSRSRSSSRSQGMGRSRSRSRSPRDRRFRSQRNSYRDGPYRRETHRDRDRDRDRGFRLLVFHNFFLFSSFRLFAVYMLWEDGFELIASKQQI